MISRASARPDFEEFVLVCSDRLLRTAYLLTRDASSAEDLLQAALARAWFAWQRLDDQPEAHVRRVMVTTYATWWRRPSPTAASYDDPPDAELWSALGRLSRRRRAVVVLCSFENLSEDDVADLLGCSPSSVRADLSKALVSLGLAPTLPDRPTAVGPTGEAL